MADVSVRFLKGRSDQDILVQLYDTVFVPSFPPSEREPMASLERVLAGEELLGAVAMTPDGVPVAALFLEWFADIRAGLLCYFAVRPDLRDRGIGRQLIAYAAPRWRTELRPHIIYAEAEDPRSGSGIAEHGDGQARLRLYAGFGARRLPIPYLMPRLNPGETRLANLLLLVAEADDTVAAPAGTVAQPGGTVAQPGGTAGAVPGLIRGAAVAEFLTRYFARAEGGPAHPGDTELRGLLAECRRTEFLQLRELSGQD
ncbi:hypothetical protein GCM10010435_46910 [Winogradskya consettensis]|uniref:N-acetyltransferase domain-containing protein n=1 Tax=Winogradskya consettensis TaxID=113560 RepID=A0A919SIQ4_9ACTN|nr:GNAT family N-acetyltransferase [Actinoplanes consettensis]GIM72766.1 hypothetical protein Aco04nite_31840 [Actinoplanes consettensis]